MFIVGADPASAIPLRMALCDDDIALMDRLAGLLTAYCKRHGFKPFISKYQTGAALLGADLHDIHILFLDVRLSDTYGIDIAKELKKRRYKYKLIFVTELLTADHRAVEVAFRYLPKAHLETTLGIYLSDAIDELGLIQTTVRLKMGRVDGGEYWETLSTDEIAYVEVRKHTCTLHMLKDNRASGILETTYYTLTQLEQEMPVDEFLRVSKTHLVQINKIVSMANYIAHLSSGENIKVSEKAFKEIRRRYLEIKGSKGIK